MKKVVEKSNVGTSAHLQKIANKFGNGIKDFSFSEEDIEASQAIGIVLPASAIACIDVAVQAMNQSTLLSIGAGYALLAAKGQLEHGEFGGHLEKRRISRERAAELMRLARFYTALPADRRGQFVSIGKSKALLLTDADSEVIEAILDDPDGDFESLSVREMRKRITELESARDSARNERDTLQYQVNALTRTQVPGEGEFDARTFEVRQEAAALEYGARICMDDLETLFGQVLAEDADPHMQELRMRSVGLAVGGALARAQALFEAVRDSMGGAMPVQPHAELFLSEEEKFRLDAGLTIIRANHKRGKEQRQDEATRQAAAHQKGPGRKIGSKNKAKGGEK